MQKPLTAAEYDAQRKKHFVSRHIVSRYTALPQPTTTRQKHKSVFEKEIGFFTPALQSQLQVPHLQPLRPRFTPLRKHTGRGGGLAMCDHFREERPDPMAAAKVAAARPPPQLTGFGDQPLQRAHSSVPNIRFAPHTPKQKLGSTALPQTTFAGSLPWQTLPRFPDPQGLPTWVTPELQPPKAPSGGWHTLARYPKALDVSSSAPRI